MYEIRLHDIFLTIKINNIICLIFNVTTGFIIKYLKYQRFFFNNEIHMEGDPYPYPYPWKGATYLTCSFGIKEDVKRVLLLLFPIACFHTAVCRQQCLNGGMCTRPNVCTCPNAFEGPACELDVDECATGAHGCLGPSSRCVNMAGWYYCACSPGYQNVIMYPIATAFSEPVNALEAIRRSPQLGTMCQGKKKITSLTIQILAVLNTNR